MEHLIPVKNDLFNVANRLRSVCASYRVFFNAKTRKFEVHNTAQKFNTLAFVCPYESLDARTVEYARYTHVNNAKNLLREVERDNEAYFESLNESSRFLH